MSILLPATLRFDHFTWSPAGKGNFARRILAASLALAALAFPGALRASEPSADEAALIKADNDFCQLCGAKGMKESFTAFAADDATMLVAGMDPVKGKEAIGRVFEGMDGIELTWHPLKAEASKAGDLGYTFGTFQMRIPGSEDKSKVQTGKYTTIWKKQADGTWKYVLDVGNHDPAPAS